MNISKGLRNNLTEMIALCDEQINRWKLTREQLSMLTNGHNGHVPQVMAMAEAAAAVHKAKRGPYKKHTKPHWTQTPEGKHKMAAVQKKAWADKRAAEKAAK